MKRSFVVLALCVGALGLLSPWWRNHTLLLDFCDYGLVMAATGRMSLGEQPYVDFLTPIQTLQFVTALGAERLFGAHYLSLTYSNSVFIVGAFVALFALLKRRLGAAVALLVSSAVVVASAVQHTILWYNAMGVVWLALAMWGTAQWSTNRREAGWLLALVWAALWLGGMTKLTYQISAISFVGALTLRSALIHEISWRDAKIRLWGCFGFGVIAPIVTELIYTGATLEQWLENVVAMPARFRVAMLGELAAARFYLQTSHDYYGAQFDFVGAWGVGLLALVTGLAVSKERRRESHDWKELVMLAVLVGGAWICGGVLLATNMEISYVSGAAWLVMAAGIALAVTAHSSEGLQRSLRIVLGIAAVSLLVPAWASAWYGTRALWGHERVARAEFVSTGDLPAQFSYLEGMRISPTMKTSLQELATKEDELMARGIPRSAFYFVNATEWMVRVVPEARHRGLPLWLAGGTTFSRGDSWAIRERMQDPSKVQALFAHDAWNYWYEGMQKTLDEEFQETRLGQRLFVYVRRKPVEPVEFAINTSSNVYAGEMTITGGPLELHIANNLFFFGSGNAHRIDLGYNLYRLEGEVIGELSPDQTADASRAVVQVRAREEGRLTDILWEGQLALSADKRANSLTFSVSPGDRRISLLLLKPEGAPAKFGWRRLFTSHAGPLETTAPWPMNPRLAEQTLDEAAMQSLFDAEKPVVAEVRRFAGNGSGDRPGSASGMYVAGSSEIWMKIDRPMNHVAGEFGLDERLFTTGAGVRVTVVCYKSGRFDVMYRRDMYPKTNDADRLPQKFEVWMPEGVGWIGLVVGPLGNSSLDAGGAWWRDVRIW